MAAIKIWVVKVGRVLFSCRRKFKFLRKVCLYYLAFAAIVTVLGLFIPTLRNFLLRPILPRPWSYLSNVQILTLMYNIRTDEEFLPRIMNCTRAKKADKIPDAPVLTEEDRMGRMDDPHHDIEQWILARDFIGTLPENRIGQYLPFLPPVQHRERAQLLELWRVLDSALRQHNVTYYVSGGTLLGVVRHRGFVPWDDDMDLNVFQEEESGLVSVLACLRMYRLLSHDKHHYRFFSRSSPPMMRVRRSKVGPGGNNDDSWEVFPLHEDTPVCRYPFIDIFIVGNFEQITVSLNKQESRRHAHPTSLILPLTKASFQGYLVPVPHQYREVVEREFDVWKCVSRAYNHIEETSFSFVVELDCHELKMMFPNSFEGQNFKLAA